MITAGVDVGAKTVKIVVLRDREVVATAKDLSGFDQAKVASELLAQALEKANVTQGDLAGICSTGAGRKIVSEATHSVTEVSAGAKGSLFINPDVRTVIDVGAEEGRAIRCTEKGKVEDFAVNEKCAAGSGAFTESMARALEVDVAELGKLSLGSDASVPMNAQCAVFAESEVVSLLHAETPKQDISKAIHDAIASRITSMARRIGLNKEVLVIGGVALNVGFIRSLNEAIEMDVIVADDPEFVNALGAALIAAERAN
ncbi:MAG: acyl-CoA dehydratase activase [Candidatus Electryonea clarkiae]|nr:acyl-CoA dehydratase activase [Candidatus Electryonea clarkiae]MDP8287611.1 acyl-CoA dehydratase activase [Candidatus Electryonea clarkiae]